MRELDIVCLLPLSVVAESLATFIYASTIHPTSGLGSSPSVNTQVEAPRHTLASIPLNVGNGRARRSIQSKVAHSYRHADSTYRPTLATLRQESFTENRLIDIALESTIETSVSVIKSSLIKV